jgi:hypothetical protein
MSLRVSTPFHNAVTYFGSGPSALPPSLLQCRPFGSSPGPPASVVPVHFDSFGVPCGRSILTRRRRAGFRE